MSKNQLSVAIVFGLAAVVMLVYASQNDGPKPQYVPQFQTEAQFNWEGAATGLDVSTGTPLDMDPKVHFWAPGFGAGLKFGDSGEGAMPVPTSHRYPAVCGGNLTAVMHHGWSSLSEPQANEWFRNPPAVAVL